MSLARFTPKNHPQQGVHDAVDDRQTPQSVFGPLDAEHHFTLDAAASTANALCPTYFTREEDGLLRSWAGERVWCNPPYSRLEGWLAKAWAEMRDRCELVVMLLPANRCEQGWWQDFVEPFRDREPTDDIRLTTHFLRGRTKFSGCKQGYTASPPFGCVVLTFSGAAGTERTTP